MRRSRKTYYRSAASLLLLLLLTRIFLGFSHFALVEHTYCSFHNRIEHTHPAGEGTDGLNAMSRSISQGEKDAHNECDEFIGTFKPTDLEKPFDIISSLAISHFSLLTEAQPLVGLRLFSLAPKGSPPDHLIIVS